MLLLLVLELLLVELELLALKDVTVDAASLARARRDAREHAAAGELVVEALVEGAGRLAALELAQHVVRLLDLGVMVEGGGGGGGALVNTVSRM